MEKNQMVGWGVTVVGVIQLIISFLEGAGPVEWVLAILVVGLGLWGALGS